MYEGLHSCAHISQVLSLKAQESVLVTYQQAVKISLLVNETNEYRLIKDDSVFLSKKLMELKIACLKCTNCHASNFACNYICLQCPNIGCEEHGRMHAKKQGHFFSIDSSNGLIYCHKCSMYVNHPLLQRSREEVLYSDMDSETKLLAQISGDSDEIEGFSTPSPTGALGLKGFVNFGSTCFISSILQTFIHNPIMKLEFFNNDHHYFNCTAANCITCSVDGIFLKFFTADSLDSFGMTDLLVNAWYRNKSLSGFEEQDAHEFWQFILNEFHRDHKRLANEQDLHHHTSCDCITHRHFTGELESIIRCTSCGKINQTLDPIMDLSLELTNLRENSTIYDCLDLYTKEELLEHYKCTCGQASSLKSLKLNTLPNVLSIQFKRFKHNLTKNDLNIRNPLYLNLEKYCNASQAFYELFALVLHSGSVNSGHYIVVIKLQNRQWLRFDDSVITLVPLEDIETTNAYLAFYLKHNIA